MEFINHCELSNEVEDISINSKKKKTNNEDYEEIKLNEFEKLNDDCLMHIFLYLSNVERVKIELG